MRRQYWIGDKISLRALEPADIVLFDSFDDEIVRNLDMLQLPQSEARRRAWFERELQGRMNDDFRFIAVNHHDDVVGTIDAFNCQRRNRTFKYSLAIAREHWGKGYASEMIILVLGYYFRELGYEKVTPHVYAFNQRSIELHEKLGFKREGQLRNMVFAQGAYHDEIYFGMTRDEFDEAHGGG